MTEGCDRFPSLQETHRLASGPGGPYGVKTIVAAVQAASVLMDREATLDKTEGLVKEAASNGANLVVLPEVFVPGTPVWMDSQPIWQGDDEWYALLVDQAVVVPGPATERLAGFARDSEVYLVI